MDQGSTDPPWGVNYGQAEEPPDRTIASEWKVAALAMLCIGESTRKHSVHKYVNTAVFCESVMDLLILT